MRKKVDNGHCRQLKKRHKCSICGRVRFEHKMSKITRRFSDGRKYGRECFVKTRFGNYCWVCVDNPECLHKATQFNVY